ncbi:MAG: hypothetical protein NVSMB24_35490 [Mucilaginibacter sp.]
MRGSHIFNIIISFTGAAALVVAAVNVREGLTDDGDGDRNDDVLKKYGAVAALVAVAVFLLVKPVA